MKRKLSIDLETYSSVDIKAGIYRYVESVDFEIMLFAYAFDNDPVTCIDFTKGEKLPATVYRALTDANVTKTAWNALFEIASLEASFNIELDATQWQCSQVGATMVGLPASLAQAGLALNLKTLKDPKGFKLIHLFCHPVKPKKKQQLTLFQTVYKRNTYKTHPAEWADFIQYCKTDVQQERLIRDKIDPIVSKAATIEERFIWWVDHKINKRGVLVDQDYTRKCIVLADEQKKRCMAEAIQLTKLKNPNSVPQIKKWLELAIGEEIPSLNKKFIPGIKAKAMDETTERVLELRAELSKSSIKKFNSIINSVSEDGRIKGLHKYFGAQKTGRWSSHIVQIHNLKKNDDDLDVKVCREVIEKYGLGEIEMLWEKPSEILSQMIRPAFISAPGHSLISTDFSSIEARITAWLAGEKWRLDIFKSHGRIYEASAAKMFKVDVKTISYVEKDKTIRGPNYPMRAKGKIGELALGFGGGWKALQRMGGEAMGLTEHEMKIIVKAWRKESPNIVLYWREIEECALNAVRRKGKEFKHKSNVSFKVEDNILWLKLPSGRYITYREPRIEQKWVEKLEAYKDTLTYIGMEQTRKTLQRLSTYGGKLVENIVQATARDLLAGALVRLSNAKFNTAIHVHDEIVNEAIDKNIASTVLKINKLMVEQPKWASGLPLSAESTVSKFYKK